MKDLLIETLSELEYPIFQQGSLSEEEEYPQSFFTFWNRTADADAFYDNDERSITWEFDLNFYSTDPDLVNMELMSAKALLKAAGFTATGAGRDIASDEPTHTGRGITVFMKEILNEKSEHE